GKFAEGLPASSRSVSFGTGVLVHAGRGIGWVGERSRDLACNRLHQDSTIACRPRQPAPATRRRLASVAQAVLRGSGCNRLQPEPYNRAMDGPPDEDDTPEDARARSGGKDVARLAGVSTATVSRVLNNPERVDPRTRHRVLEAAAKLRYVPHGAARSLRSHRSKMVGAVVPSFDYALYARTTSALHQRLAARGYSLVLAEQHYDLDEELLVARQLVQHGVDAFVFVGVDHHPALFALLEDYGRPYVLTWGIDPMGRHPCIGFDNQAATREMTRYLVGLGHRRFGLL